MSTPSKNAVNEDDDDDQDYIPVGILQLSSIRQPVHFETSQNPLSAAEDDSVRVSSHEKQYADALFQPPPPNLPQFEQLGAVGDFEKGPSRQKSETVEFPLHNQTHQKSSLTDETFRKHDHLQQYKLLLQLMQQQQQKTQESNEELTPSSVKLQGKGGTQTLVQNALPSGSYENQRQSQFSREDLNSNVPVESKNQLLKILSLGQGDNVTPHLPGSGYASLQSGQIQNCKSIADYRVNSNSEIQTNMLQGHLNQNTPIHVEDQRREHNPHVLSNPALRIDISSSHIPKPADQLLQQSPTSLSSATGFNSHPNVNHQHPEISKRLNSPVSPGRQSTSPRQAISPRQGGSPRQITSSPCHFVSPKQPVSPRGTTLMGTWKSQPSSPQPLQPTSPRAHANLPPSPSSQQVIIPARKSGHSSLVNDIPSPTPLQLPVPLSSSIHLTSKSVDEELHHLPSRFQPIPSSASQFSFSGGIVHHRPLFDASHNQSNPGLSSSSASNVALISTPTNLASSQPTPVLNQNIDSSSSVWTSKQNLNDNMGTIVSQSQQYSHDRTNQPKAVNSMVSSQGLISHTEIALPNCNESNNDNNRVHVKQTSLFDDKEDCGMDNNVVFQLNEKDENIFGSENNDKQLNEPVENSGDLQSLRNAEVIPESSSNMETEKTRRRSESKKLLNQRKEVVGESGDEKTQEIIKGQQKTEDKVNEMNVEGKSNSREVEKHVTAKEVQDSSEKISSDSAMSEDSQKSKDDVGVRTSGRDVSSKRQRKPKVPFEDSCSSSSSGQVKKIDIRSQQRRNDEKLKREKPKARTGSSLLKQSILTRSGLRLKGQMNMKQANKNRNIPIKRGQLIKNAVRGSDQRRSRQLASKKDTDKESEKDKRKGNEMSKEPEKDGKKGTEIGKNFEKDKKKGTEGNKEPEKDKKKENERGKETDKDKKKGIEGTKEPEKDKKKENEKGKETDKDKKKGKEIKKEPEKDKKKGNNGGKELEKDKKKGKETSKELERKKGIEGTEKDKKKENERGKEPEKNKKKGKEIIKEPDKDKKKVHKNVKEPEKELRQRQVDKDLNSTKDAEMNTRSSSRLLARQSVGSEDKNKNTPPKSKSQNQSEPDERVAATRRSRGQDGSSDIPEKPTTRGMTTRQSDGTRKRTSKRPIEFLESLPFLSRKRSKSGEVSSKESSSTNKDESDTSDTRSTRSKLKSRSQKSTIETDEDEDEEYKLDDDDDDDVDEEDESGDDRNSPTLTRSRRFRFQRRKISMRLRGEARKRKYNLMEESDESQDEKSSDSDEEMEDSETDSLSERNIKSQKPERKKERKSPEHEPAPDTKVRKNASMMSGLKAEVKETGDQSSLSGNSMETALVATDLSKLVAFKLVPLSPQEIAEASDPQLALPLNGFLLPGTCKIFLPPHCIRHVETEKMDSSEMTESSKLKASHPTIPACSRVLVTPRPISSVTDSSNKSSAFSSPSSKPSSKEQVVSYPKHTSSNLSGSHHSGLRNQHIVPTAPTPPPAVTMSSSSSSRGVSSVQSALPWNSPSLPTPPPSVSSSSSHSSSSSWNPVANLPWMPDSSSSSVWSTDPVGNEGWRNNGYLVRGSFGDSMALNTDMPMMPASASLRPHQETYYQQNDRESLPEDSDADPSRNDRMMQGLFRDASNLSPSGYNNIALPGLGQQDISYLESKLQQEMDISSSMLLSEVPYEEGIHESVSVHHDAGNLVCSVNLDDADGLGSATPTLHLPNSDLENIGVPPLPTQQPQLGVMALKEDRNISLQEKMGMDGGDTSNTLPKDVRMDTKPSEKSILNPKRHLYDICIVDEKRVGKCRTCGNTYSLTSIYRHLKKHDNLDLGYACDLCGKKYSQKHHLTGHMKKFHATNPNMESQPNGNQKEKQAEAAEYKTRDEAWSDRSSSHPALQTESSMESNISSGSKESKKKWKKKSAERKVTKDEVVYEQMPESPNAVSEDSKRETRLEVERFRRMKAKKKFATRNSMSGITLDISQLNSDDEESVSDGKGVKINDDGPDGESNVLEELTTEQNEKNESLTNDMDKMCVEKNICVTPEIGTKVKAKAIAEADKTEEGHTNLGPDKNPVGLVHDEGQSAMLGEDVVDDKQDVSAGESPETGKNRFPCTLCTSVLSSKCSFIMHMRRHNNEKDKFCSYCGKGFITSQELKSHERTHTGERPFTCEICKHTFAHSGSYQSHKKIHIKRGETTPFPPEKCFPGGKLPMRGKRRVNSDISERPNLEKDLDLTAQKKDLSQKVSETEANLPKKDFNSVDFRRKSLDSGITQQNLKPDNNEMGPPWPMTGSDNFSWKNRPNTERDMRQVVTLESNIVQDHRGEVQHRSVASSFRDQASPPFYSPTSYSPTVESPMMSPKPNQSSNQDVPSGLPTSPFHSPSTAALKTHIKSSPQEQNFPSNQAYSNRNDVRPFVSPVQMNTLQRPQLHASPSPQNIATSNYNQPPQQYNMFHPSSSSPNYSQQIQHHNTPQHSMQEPSGDMVKNLMSQYSLSSPSYSGSSQMDYSASPQSLTVNRSPLHNLPQSSNPPPSQQPGVQQNQQMQQHPQQHPQQRQQQQQQHHHHVPVYHQSQQFPHHLPSDMPHQPTLKQQPQQQPAPGRHLQQLLTQQAPPPPMYTSNKPTAPPPYPSNIPYTDYYGSPQTQDKSQTPRMQNEPYQSPNMHPQHGFNTTYSSPSHFQTGPSSQPAAISVIRSNQSASSDNRSSAAHFTQPVRVPSGQMNTSAFSSSSPTQPYHHPSPSSSAQSPGYFHQGPS